MRVGGFAVRGQVRNSIDQGSRLTSDCRWMPGDGGQETMIPMGGSPADQTGSTCGGVARDMGWRGTKECRSPWRARARALCWHYGSADRLAVNSWSPSDAPWRRRLRPPGRSRVKTQHTRKPLWPLVCRQNKALPPPPPHYCTDTVSIIYVQ